MRKKPQKYLVDIQLSIDHILHFHLGEIDGLEDFAQNITAIRAVEREFLIVGEAVKKLKDLGIELSHSDWLINFRNTMAHQYDQVSPRRIFEHCRYDLEGLNLEIADLLED